MEPLVKEWEASFTLGSVLWVTVWGGTVYLDGDGGEGAGMGAGWEVEGPSQGLQFFPRTTRSPWRVLSKKRWFFKFLKALRGSRSRN